MARMKDLDAEPTVVLTEPAIEALSHWVQWQGDDGLETGGYLHGQVEGSRVIVRRVTGPGQRSKRGPHSLTLDMHEAVPWEIAGEGEEETMLVGDWHSHPVGSPGPSDRDKTSWMDHWKEDGLESYVGIIAGCFSGEFDPTNPALLAWCVTPGPDGKPVLREAKLKGGVV